MTRTNPPLVALVVGCAASTALADPGTAFTYQGQLKNAGTFASGPHDLRFRLYSVASGGVQITQTLCADNVPVVDGVFTVVLDFGDQYSAGDPLFLELDVRQDTGLDCANAAGFTVLAPRQALSITPFAAYASQARNANSAESAENANLFGGQASTFYRNAANLNSGTLADARLSTNVPRLNAANTFTAQVTMTNPLNTFAGTGTGLTALNASALESGTIPQTVLQGTYPLAVSFTNAANAFSGSGTELTGLNATALAFGTIPNARLTGLYTNVISMNNPLNTFGGDGAAITNLNAANLASGTLPNARFGGSYTNPVSITNVSNTFAGNGAGLFNIDASGIGTGTLPSARLAGTYANALTFSNAGNSFTGNGAGLTSLSASNISTGTLGDARHSPNVAMKNLANTFTQNCTFANDLTVGGAFVADTVTLTIPAEREYVLGRFDFLPGEEVGESDSPYIFSGLTSKRYAASVHLPQGAVVTALRLHTVDAATGDATAFLLRRPHDGTAGGTMAQVSSAGNSPGAVLEWSDTTISAPTINNTANQYVVRLDMPGVSGGSSCAMRVIRIEYTVTQPLP